MTFWQWLIDFLKTIGVGALAGAVVGAGLTRRQRSKEALQAIRAANYREVVGGYTALVIHLEHVQSAARRTLASARAILHFKSLDNQVIPSEFIEEIKQELAREYSEYEQLRAGLPEKIAPISAHQGQTTFFMSVTLSTMAVDMLDHMLQFLAFSVSEGQFAEADKRYDELRKEIRHLNARWIRWKDKEERAAAGLRVTPIHQSVMKALRSLVRRDAQARRPGTQVLVPTEQAAGGDQTREARVTES